ncbi:aminotransferase class IV [Pontibacter sp. 172403-2]|uniref:aminotransferase class IV n=1 Tax=Pontibacter rufus TaxID=2791028 RepID=UPI0018AFE20A|nr:aminotransferase class IV [Pontibacter sp. 172403-2]MBF9253691.1 aminotransferase class IV [Pontibacter sp. 172403-2]
MPSIPKLYAFLRGEILPLDEAFLHVSDLSIQRGYGVFDFLKVQDGHPLFMNEYLARFYESARLMGLSVPVPDHTLKAAIHELILKNNLPLSGIKMILTGGYSANGYNPAAPNLIILQQPLSLPDQALVHKGIKIITHAYVRELAQAKTINYTMGIRLINEIKARGADDVLYHHEGIVTELPRCNFFIIKQDKTVATPGQDVLPGITRKHVLELAGSKYKTEEGTITLDDVFAAKEAFLTSTTKRILPVVQVDDMIIGDGKPGPVSLSLLADLISLEQAQLATGKK